MEPASPSVHARSVEVILPFLNMFLIIEIVLYNISYSNYETVDHIFYKLSIVNCLRSKMLGQTLCAENVELRTMETKIIAPKTKMSLTNKKNLNGVT
jgi:hypothetical protein